MVADVPVGVLLSGGIDSSIVVALLADEGQRDLATFSIGFERVGDYEGDEFEYSDLIAREFGTDHHQLLIPSADVLNGLDGAVEAMSEPMVSHDCVAFYLLSQQVSQHVKVVQSGQGADEILAGYEWYPPLAGVDRRRSGGRARRLLRELLRPDAHRARRHPGRPLVPRRRPEPANWPASTSTGPAPTPRWTGRCGWTRW